MLFQNVIPAEVSLVCVVKPDEFWDKKVTHFCFWKEKDRLGFEVSCRSLSCYRTGHFYLFWSLKWRDTWINSNVFYITISFTVLFEITVASKSNNLDLLHLLSSVSCGDVFPVDLLVFWLAKDVHRTDGIIVVLTWFELLPESSVTCPLRWGLQWHRRPPEFVLLTVEPGWSLSSFKFEINVSVAGYGTVS